MKLTKIQWIHGSAYSDALYMTNNKLKTSWADERIEDEGYGMNLMNDKQPWSKFQEVSPVERS